MIEPSTNATVSTSTSRPTVPGPTLTKTVRIALGIDDRDIGGEFIGMGLCFDVEGAEGLLVWSINTGWALRPLTTPGLRPGAQERASMPGVDHVLATRFPRPLGASLVLAGESKIRNVRVSSQNLLELLLTKGQQAIFDHLESMYIEIFAKPGYAASLPLNSDTTSPDELPA